MRGETNRSKILILGGSGFVSGTLASRARSQGHEVWVLTRGSRPLPAGLLGLTADRHDQEAFRKAIHGAGMKWDAVFDCIGMNPADARQDIDVFRSLTKHLIFISTDFVYDPLKRRFPETEESSGYLSGGYGGNKRLCELEFLHSDANDMAWTVVRPCHIYGPGSKLGCLPLHGRDADLIDKIRAGNPLSLVGGGHFLQQPIFAADLSHLMLSCIGNEKTYRQIFCAAGPDIIESRKYYEIIAQVLGTTVTFAEVPVDKYFSEHPESASFLCHRIYDLSKLKHAGAAIPATPIEEGLRVHVEHLLKEK